MTTKDITAEELVAVLKFTPRTYTVSIWGYGGERVMGTVDPKVWNYCMSKKIDLQDLAWGDYDEMIEEQGLDPDLLPFTPGSWYECDNMGHVSGASRDSSTIQVLDENNKTVFERATEACDGCDDSPGLCCNDEVWIGSRKRGEVVFVGSSNEKGTFFEGPIELKAPFDITKLEIHYDEIDGEEIINSVYYDGEEIENNGYGTDGKSSDMNMVHIIDDSGKFVRYDPEESDNLIHETGTDNPIDFPASACTSEQDLIDELEQITEDMKTSWFTSNIKPVHKGEYECEFAIATWPWPAVRMCEWTGRTWKDATGEKIKGSFKWRGLAIDPSLEETK
jgi:hypothetical protein